MVQVLVLPADGSEIRYDTFITYKGETGPPISPPEDPNVAPDYRRFSNRIWELCLKVVPPHHASSSWQTYPQSTFNLLPQIGEEYWPAEAWKKGTVLGTDKWHMLFTTHAQRDLKTHPHLEHCVSGDVFVLGVSKAKDENGQRYYVHLHPDDFDERTLSSGLLGIVDCLDDIKKIMNSPQ